ncbi:Ankyrin-2 [Dirofilaria immitis]
MHTYKCENIIFGPTHANIQGKKRMAKSPKHRSASNKKSSSKSPRSKDSTQARSHYRKTSRSRSRSRSAQPRSRSSSRGRGSTSSKKKIASPVVKKFDDSAADVKKIIPVSHRTPKNGLSYKLFPFSDKGLRRRGITMRVLQPMNLSNLKVKGIKLKHRFSSHCKRLSRYYAVLVILGLIGLGIFYTGYSVDQLAKYARQHINSITTYVQKRG